MPMDVARTSPNAEVSPARADLETRTADLSGIIEALVACQTATARRADTRSVAALDPVALTEALHPRGLRLPRKQRRRASTGRNLNVRVFFLSPGD